MANEGFVQQLLESDIELKSSILQLDIAKEYDFFKKDLVLGNIDDYEKRFIDLVFDLISDMRHFSSTIIERQYIVMTRTYQKNPDYKKRVDVEVSEYNTQAEELVKELQDKLDSDDTEEREKNELRARLKNIRTMTASDYMLAAAKHEGLVSFFNGASEKFIVLVYGKLAVSRSKKGYQQSMLLTKRIKQTYNDATRQSGLFGISKKKKEGET